MTQLMLKNSFFLRLRACLASLILLGPTWILAAEGQTIQADLLKNVEALYQEIAPKISDVPSIDVASAKAAGAILLDVRSPKERAVSIIPGAITEAEFKNVYQAQPKLVVVYCTIGYRSGLRTRELRAEGIDARNLRGGILAWIAHGGNLNDSFGKATHQVHVYAKAWAVVPTNFSAVY